jgi:glutamate-ammonia-ligase adenylyltransferase
VTGEVSAICAEALNAPRDRQATVADVAAMRERLDAAYRDELQNPWALKHVRGGLMDVDFIGQAGVLLTARGDGRPGRRRWSNLAASGWLSVEEAASVGKAADLQLALQQMERVALERSFDPKTAGEGVRQAMVRAGEAEDFDGLEHDLRAAQASVRSVFERLFAV